MGCAVDRVRDLQMLPRQTKRTRMGAEGEDSDGIGAADEVAIVPWW